MNGLSTRFAFKILSKVFNFDNTEVAANPVHLLYVLEQQIEREQFPPNWSRSTSPISRSTWRSAMWSSSARRSRPPTWKLFRVRPEHLRPLRDLRRLLDPGPGIPRSGHRRKLRPRIAEQRAGKIEKPAGISNPKDFRNEIVNFVLRARAPTTAARIPPGPATRSCAR
jgi:serine protein kinase